MKRTLAPISFFFIFLFVVPCYALTPKAIPAEPHNPTIGETFAGETLLYDIGFWIFKEVAVAKLTLTREEGGYKAVLSAHTVGFVDTMFQHRSDVYTAHLKEVDGGQRFATVSLTSIEDINGNVRHGVKEVDRKAGVFTWRSWGGGKDERSGTVHFPPNTYVDDPLGGFYNFRFNVYGKAAPGAEFTITTFPKEDYKNEYIKMNMGPVMKTGQKNEKTGEPGEGGAEAAYVARVKMSKNVFGTDLADIDIYFSPGLVPLRAEARDIVFFTDVTGTLRSMSKGR